MRTFKIDFTCIEIADSTDGECSYEIWVDGDPFAIINGTQLMDIQFQPASIPFTVSECMMLLTSAWQHWDALDSWSDITFELSLA